MGKLKVVMKLVCSVPKLIFKYELEIIVIVFEKLQMQAGFQYSIQM